MAARVTTDEIKSLMGTENLTKFSDTVLELYIAQTNRFVNAKLLGEGLTGDQLEDVELYLTAYFLNVRRAPPTSTSVGSISRSRQGNFAFAGMLGDIYGQRAIELDTTGVLADLATALNRAARGEDNASAAPSVFSPMSDADTDLLT